MCPPQTRLFIHVTCHGASFTLMAISHISPSVAPHVSQSVGDNKCIHSEWVERTQLEKFSSGNHNRQTSYISTSFLFSALETRSGAKVHISGIESAQLTPYLLYIRHQTFAAAWPDGYGDHHVDTSRIWNSWNGGMCS